MLITPPIPAIDDINSHISRLWNRKLYGPRGGLATLIIGYHPKHLRPVVLAFVGSEIGTDNGTPLQEKYGSSISAVDLNKYGVACY